MEPNLELARTKLSVCHIAQYGSLPDAESLLNGLRETVTFLERRIAREKLAIASKPDLTLSSEFVRAS